MNFAVEFTASLCGGWLTDDSNRLVRRWLLGPRPAAPAASVATRQASEVLLARQQRWFDHMARTRDGREWLPLDAQLRSIGCSLPRN